MYLVDTNLLLRSLQPEHAQYDTATTAISTLLTSQGVLAIVPQVAAEFWNVCTRPQEANGLGLSSDQAAHRLAAFERTFTLYRDVPGIYGHWRRLLAQYDVKGKQVHDARLVAAMMAHGLTHILTFNIRDFERYEAITVVDPVLRVE